MNRILRKFLGVVTIVINYIVLYVNQKRLYFPLNYHEQLLRENRRTTIKKQQKNR